jgi:hypothetical protein
VTLGEVENHIEDDVDDNDNDDGDNDNDGGDDDNDECFEDNTCVLKITLLKKYSNWVKKPAYTGRVVRCKLS